MREQQRDEIREVVDGVHAGLGGAAVEYRDLAAAGREQFAGGGELLFVQVLGGVVVGVGPGPVGAQLSHRTACDECGAFQGRSHAQPRFPMKLMLSPVGAGAPIRPASTVVAGLTTAMVLPGGSAPASVSIRAARTIMVAPRTPASTS